MSTSRLLPGWVAALGCVLALAAAALSEPSAVAQPMPAATAVSEAPVTQEVAHGPDHGLHPLADNEMVPLKWMPPGSSASPLPSEEIFPPQTITIRFNHKLHVKQFQQPCRICHGAAFDSKQSSDRLLPDPVATCDHCHDVDHSNPDAVRSGGEPEGACTWCHVGEDAGKDNKVARFELPAPNLRMNHQAHLQRNIDCAQCHGHVEELELATREQLPRMAGCFGCHAQSGAAQGNARGACTTCHLTEPSGLMQTVFSTGELQPPMWLHGAAHTPDWIARHKLVAGANSTMCGSCHADEYCVACHDGKVRPRNVHPNDWISMHPQAARFDNPRCTSCHNLQSFCADCHRRVGVARDVPSANRQAGRRFHPPPQIWTTAPRSPQHHAWEAQRNIQACVSCHTERDCATCHATKGLRGGQGVSPHPIDFASQCGLALRRNPRPCYVCHQQTDPALAVCR